MARTSNKNKVDSEVKLSKPEEIEETDNIEGETELDKNDVSDLADKEQEVSAYDILILRDPNTKDYTGAIFVRQYSNEVHGDDFEALADEFCTKSPKGKVGVYVKVPTQNVGLVEVRYREKADYEQHLDKQDPNAPMEDKVKVFNNKVEAVRFGSQKIQSTVVVSRSKGIK